MISDSFWAPFWPAFAAMAPFWQPFGAVMELFWLAFSAYAGLELQREPFQHHFTDLASFVVPLLRIFDASLLNMYIILGGRLAPSVHLFSFPSCPFERASAAKRNVSVQVRPEDHFGGIICSSFVAEYHLGLTGALQHCQHNCGFHFLAAQVFIDFEVIWGPMYMSALIKRSLNFDLFSVFVQVSF